MKEGGQRMKSKWLIQSRSIGHKDESTEAPWQRVYHNDNILQ